MENASKALIIAGAILISILLISIGIIILNSTGSITDQTQSQADSMAIQTFNGQFTSYEGPGKSAAQIKSLINAVNASNASNAADKKVTLSGISSAASLTNTNTYKVTITYTSGYVATIAIAKE